MKVTKTEKRMRSTTAPMISAGVMIANMAWNMTKMYSGMPRGGEAKLAVIESIVTLRSIAFERSPKKAPSPEKARL
jgi:hypothetical protein